MKFKSAITFLLALLMVSSIFVVNTTQQLNANNQPLNGPQSAPNIAEALSLSPVHILVYTEYVDARPGQEYENTMNAIDNTYGTNYQLTSLTNWTLLDSLLPGNDVLLIPEQENATVAKMKTVGADWAATLTDFVDNGGVVALLDFGNVSAPGLGLHIYNSSGLMHIGPVIDQYPNGTLGTMHRHDFGDALCRRIEYQPEPRNNTMAVDITDGNVAVDIYQYPTDLHDPIVVHKIMGKGHIVFMGFDMSDPDANYENIVGNAIRLPNHVVFDASQQTEYRWEFPPPNPDGYQGGAFVDGLVSAGFAVSRMDTFSAAFLNACDVVVCTLPKQYIDDYDAAEIAVLDAFVAAGGSIFIQSDWTTYGDDVRALANSFGYDWARDDLWDTDDLQRYWQESQIYYTGDNLLSHPITTNVERVEFYASDGFTVLPTNVEKIIVSDWDNTNCWGEGGWYDNYLGADGITTMAVSKYGSGRVCVVLDSNFMDGIEDIDSDGAVDYLDSDNDVLLLNTVHWLAGISATNDAPQLTGLTHLPASPTHGDPVIVNVTATDADGLENITCYYRDNLGAWLSVPMTPLGGDLYTAAIGTFSSSEEKDYYVRAFDSSADKMESVSSVVYLNGINYFPETPMLYDPGTTDNDGVFLLNWTASIDADGFIDHYEIQMSNDSQFATTLGIITAYTDDYTLTVFENDTYYFRVRAVDDDGTVGFWSFQQWINVVIILGPIVSTPVLSPSSPVHGDSVNVSVDVTDQDGVKNVTCYYSVNSGPWQNVSMTNPTGDTYNCELGTYFVDDIVEYYIRAYDNSTSYNPTTTTTYSFEILNQPPTEPTLYDPGTVITVSDLLVNWTAGSDLEGAIDHYELQMSFFSDFSVIADQWSVPTTDHVVTGLSDGTFYFRVKTVDDKGASSSWSNTEDIIVDMSGPTISNPLLEPADPLHGDSVTLNVTITDPSGVKNATCFYNFNNGSWQFAAMTLGTGDEYSCDIGSVSVDDVIYYYIESYDNSANFNMANTTIYSFTVLNQPPEAPILIDPGTILSVDNFVLDWTEPFDLEGAIDHYIVQMSANSEFTLILDEWNVTVSDRAFTSMSNGIYYFRVCAVDDHGALSDWSNFESVEIQVSSTTTTPPTTTTTTDTTTTTTTDTTTTDTTTTGTGSTPTTPTFDPEILNMVFLLITMGSMAIIIIIVVAIIKQRATARRKYQF
jgi:hypothetical protein